MTDSTSTSQSPAARRRRMPRTTRPTVPPLRAPVVGLDARETAPPPEPAPPPALATPLPAPTLGATTGWSARQPRETWPTRLAAHPVGWGILTSAVLLFITFLWAVGGMEIVGIGALVAFTSGIAVAAVGGAERARQRLGSPARGAIKEGAIVFVLQIIPLILLTLAVYDALQGDNLL